MERLKGDERVLSLSYKFDYHMHTKLSDGQNSMEEMLHMAKSLDLKKFGITDHFETNAGNSVRVSAEEYTAEFEKIKETANREGLKFYRGIETGIGETGLLIPINVIERDYTIASVHKVPLDSSFDESEYWKKYRDMVENAVKNCDFEILGHVEGYLPIKFDGYGETTFEQRRKIEKEIAEKYFDMDWYSKIAKYMKENEIALEIHGATNSPRIEVIKLMKENGVKFSFGSDAHTVEQMPAHRKYIYEVADVLEINDNDIIELD